MFTPKDCRSCSPHLEIVPAAPNDEAQLPAAVHELYRAVGALVDPDKELHNGVVRQGPSLYEALIGEMPTKNSGEGGRFIGRSMPPCWTDALDAKAEIDRRAKQMHPAGESTPHRLRALAARKWAPPDTRRVRDHAAEISSWAVTIKGLIEPQHVKSIAAPCPSCGRRWVYRTHAGEQVRQAALQLIVDVGCTCQVCRVHYPPEKYLWLCRVLGFDLPAGIAAPDEETPRPEG